MKITKTETWFESIRLKKPYSIAFRSFDEVEIVFVRIEGQRGIWGIGSASPVKEVTGESVKDCKEALLKNLESLLLGQDIRKIRQLSEHVSAVLTETPSAAAAIDIAMYDLYAKMLKIPLADVLGRKHQSFPTSVTIGIKSVKETLEEAQEIIHRGFRIIKLKIGKSMEEDTERILMLREKMDKSILIRVDPNQSYTVSSIQEFIRKTQSANLEFIEQPLPFDDIIGMLSLPEHIKKRMAGDESLINETDAFIYSSQPHPFGIYNIKLMKCGGITKSLLISSIAHLAGIEVMWGCMDESVVSISAALHAALASPSTRYLDLDGCFDLERDIFSGGFILKDGCLSIGKKSGLGVEPI